MATIDTSAIQTFTAAELLKGVNHAIMHITMGGQSYTVAGKTFSRPDLEKLKKMRKELSDEVALETAGGMLTSLVSFEGE